MNTATELRKNTDFSHIKPTDTQYLPGGLRDFLYRDLGVAKATKGKVIAHLVKANLPPENGTGWHFHVADFQIVIMMKGWAKFMYEDKPTLVSAGDCVHQAPGITHYFV
jgi:mannose-6-phosphate isomerase-like protein (cupin superfamily)